ncbi:MAG: hypothetical protein ABF756_09025 [Liquorilactobacillus ghanensis]
MGKKYEEEVKLKEILRNQYLKIIAGAHNTTKKEIIDLINNKLK